MGRAERIALAVAKAVAEKFIVALNQNQSSLEPILKGQIPLLNRLLQDELLAELKPFKPKAKDRESYNAKIKLWYNTLNFEIWEAAFPDLNVRRNAKQAALWLHNKWPHQKLNFDAFFQTWMRKEQADAGRNNQQTNISQRERRISALFAGQPEPHKSC